MQDIFFRVIVGGIVVSSFAVLGDLLKPKTFAGLFGAAPSVALATLALAVIQHGRVYASVEARSMVLGALAFCVYALVVSRLLIRRKLAVVSVTCAALVVWFGTALGLWYAVLRHRS